MKQISAIVLAAGSGLRFKSRIPKPLVKINSKPIIIYSLEVLSNDRRIEEIIVTVNKKNKEAIARTIREFDIKKVSNIVLGGVRRQDSVSNALSALKNKKNLVLIHDSARPFITKALVNRLIKEADKNHAAIPGMPVKSTIKKATPVNGGLRVRSTIDRAKLYEIQTPQVFDADLIKRAYRRHANSFVTDDSSLVERLGVRVRLVEGSEFNIKITSPDDLILARLISKQFKLR